MLDSGCYNKGMHLNGAVLTDCKGPSRVDAGCVCVLLSVGSIVCAICIRIVLGPVCPLCPSIKRAHGPGSDDSIRTHHRTDGQASTRSRDLAGPTLHLRATQSLHPKGNDNRPSACARALNSIQQNKYFKCFHYFHI